MHSARLTPVTLLAESNHKALFYSRQSIQSTFILDCLMISRATWPICPRADRPKWNGAVVVKLSKKNSRRVFPESEFVYVSGAGHWVHADNPVEFLDVLLPFVNFSKQFYFQPFCIRIKLQQKYIMQVQSTNQPTTISMESALKCDCPRVLNRW